MAVSATLYMYMSTKPWPYTAPGMVSKCSVYHRFVRFSGAMGEPTTSRPMLPEIWKPM